MRTGGLIEQFQQDGRFIADRRGDWRGAIAHFNAQPEHDRYPVLVHTRLIESDALRDKHDRRLEEYCLFPVTSLYPIDAARERLVPLPRTTPGRLEPAVRQRIEDNGGAWVIVSGQGSEFRVQGSGQDTRSRWRIVYERSFGTVHVIQLRREPTLNFER
jgi:hypothetical protein